MHATATNNAVACDHLRAQGRGPPWYMRCMDMNHIADPSATVFPSFESLENDLLDDLM